MDYVCIGPMIHPGSSSLYLLILLHPIHIFSVALFFFFLKINPLKRPIIWGCCLIKMCLKLAEHRMFWNAGIADSLAKLQNNPVSYHQISTVRDFSYHQISTVRDFPVLSSLLKFWLPSLLKYLGPCMEMSLILVFC